jgi:F-type H+-transporting ATPase subunit b
MPAFLQPDIQQIISQAISFVLLLVLLRKFAWGPLLSILDQRRHRVEEEFRQIAQSKSELARLQQEYAARLTSIEDEARTKIQQAIIEGKRVSAEIQEQAREQSSAIMTKSREAVDMEIAKARVTLRDQIAQMTVGAVERILKAKLDAKSDRHLVDEALAELDRSQARTRN